MTTELTIKHANYMMTILEVVEAIESLTTSKVVSLVEYDGKLRFTLREREPEPEPGYPECPECGQSLDSVFELKNGRCVNCS